MLKRNNSLCFATMFAMMFSCLAQASMGFVNVQTGVLIGGKFVVGKYEFNRKVPPNPGGKGKDDFRSRVNDEFKQLGELAEDIEGACEQLSIVANKTDPATRKSAALTKAENDNRPATQIATDSVNNLVKMIKEKKGPVATLLSSQGDWWALSSDKQEYSAEHKSFLRSLELGIFGTVLFPMVDKLFSLGVIAELDLSFAEVIVKDHPDFKDSTVFSGKLGVVFSMMEWLQLQMGIGVDRHTLSFDVQKEASEFRKNYKDNAVDLLSTASKRVKDTIALEDKIKQIVEDGDVDADAAEAQGNYQWQDSASVLKELNSIDQAAKEIKGLENRSKTLWSAFLWARLFARFPIGGTGVFVIGALGARTGGFGEMEAKDLIPDQGDSSFKFKRPSAITLSIGLGVDL